MLAGSAAWAQPERDPRGTGQGGDRPALRQGQPEGDRPILDQISPERFRERLANMLAELEASAERLRSAIGSLDEGATVAEVIDQLGGPMRARWLADRWGQWRESDERPGAGRSPGRPEGDQPGGRGPWMRDVPPERVLAFLQEHAPDFGERLGRLRADRPEEADRFLMRFSPRVSEIMAAREHDPELADLLVRDFQLGIELMNAGGRLARARGAEDEAAIADAEAEVRRLAEEQVDLKLAQREHELARATERLDAVRAELEAQRDNREALCNQIVEQAGRRPGYRGGSGGDRPGRGGPPEDRGRRDRRGNQGDG